MTIWTRVLRYNKQMILQLCPQPLPCSPEELEFLAT